MQVQVAQTSNHVVSLLKSKGFETAEQLAVEMIRVGLWSKYMTWNAKWGPSVVQSATGNLPSWATGTAVEVLEELIPRYADRTHTGTVSWRKTRRYFKGFFKPRQAVAELDSGKIQCWVIPAETTFRKSQYSTSSEWVDWPYSLLFSLEGRLMCAGTAVDHRRVLEYEEKEYFGAFSDGEGGGQPSAWSVADAIRDQIPLLSKRQDKRSPWPDGHWLDTFACVAAKWLQESTTI
ncbi:hypothetical protein AB4074_16740 [Arthrobacter sp. 2MCAF14]